MSTSISENTNKLCDANTTIARKVQTSRKNERCERCNFVFFYEGEHEKLCPKCKVNPLQREMKIPARNNQYGITVRTGTPADITRLNQRCTAGQ